MVVSASHQLSSVSATYLSIVKLVVYVCTANMISNMCLITRPE
jgi:hypothetical protein